MFSVSSAIVTKSGKTVKEKPNIPHRNRSDFTYIKGSKPLLFDRKSYHQRSKVETVFSVIKRKYGSVLRNRSYATQQVELISKLIVYNLDRKINYLLLILGGCTKASIRKQFKYVLQ